MKTRTIIPVFKASLLTGLLTISACKKDQPDPAPPVVQPPAKAQKVFVVNEGNFMSSNASVSLYYPSTSTVEEDRYNAQNGQKIGDVALSMRRVGSEYFIVVNNSNKIVVCDLELKKKAEITGLTQPRYIQPIPNNLAYVSQYHSSAIAIVNLHTRAVVGSIPLPGTAEQMATSLDLRKVFVANGARNYVYVIATDVNEVVDSIPVNKGARYMATDKSGAVWVMSQGDWAGSDAPQIMRINSATSHADRIFAFTKQDYIGAMCMNAAGDSLYYLHNGVRRFSINDTELPASAFIPSASINLYALGLNPKTHEVYVSDAVDYTQRSLVTVYSPKGDSVTSFRAGVNATHFLFD